MTTFRTIKTVDFRMMPALDHRIAERPVINTPLQRDIRRGRAGSNRSNGSTKQSGEMVHVASGADDSPVKQGVNEMARAKAPELSTDKSERAGAQRRFRVIELLVVISVVAGVARVLVPALSSTRIKETGVAKLT